MAARLVTRRYDRALAPAGVTANGFSILARLDREGTLTLGTLAARLAMDRSTLSREVAPLIAAGLVEAAADDGDRRKRLLSLSDSGAARMSLARPLWAAAQASIEDGFGTARAAELVAELQALVGAAA
jgi:DNA-binding MarR family transcriptional regulator